MTASSDFVSWLHVGDLHASDEDGWRSVDTLARIVEAVRDHLPPGAVDFAYLPGDNANHGTREQYRRIARVLRGLALPWHAIPGDHDVEPGSLADFRRELAPGPLPRAERIGHRRVLLLDVVSAGAGGPDFRLGDVQTAWLERELGAARAACEPAPVVLMHAFPGDLKAGGPALGRLFADAGVAFVDTGHTHYNELLNDGAVIYSATRSTGQIEEGDAGFSITAVDGDVASWRFKALDSGWPFVLITSPADERLAVARQAPVTADTLEVHALVLGRDIAAVEATLDDGAPVPMLPAAHRPGLWRATLARPVDGVHRIAVLARAVGQSPDGPRSDVQHDEIRFRVAPEVRPNTTFGEHHHSIGAWPRRGLLGTRLGPNANGRHW